MKITKRDIHDIVDRINFRFVQPHDSCAVDDLTLVKVLNRVMPLSHLNTTIEGRDAEVLDYFKPVAHVRTMSTLALGYVIKEIVAHLEEDEIYLNIGVWNGFTFFSGALNREKQCVGVDNFSEFDGPRDRFMAVFNTIRHAKATFHDMDYLDYFETIHKEKIGFYFYDGNHSYEHQLKALDTAKPYLSPGAIIMVDDTNNSEVRNATLDFLKLNHGHFELVVDQFTRDNNHPTYHNGFMLLIKV